MVVFLATSIISCSQAMNIIHRLTKVVGLTESQKSEIVSEVRKTIPFCPVIIKKDAK
jgi:hypothetical protein